MNLLILTVALTSGALFAAVMAVIQAARDRNQRQQQITRDGDM